jgi:hypothetical protein
MDRSKLSVQEACIVGERLLCRLMTRLRAKRWGLREGAIRALPIVPRQWCCVAPAGCLGVTFQMSEEGIALVPVYSSISRDVSTLIRLEALASLEGIQASHL